MRARDNQLKGLQAGQAASLPLRGVAVGDVAGPCRHPSAKHQFLLPLSGICLVQVQTPLLGPNYWDPSTVFGGTSWCRAQASLSQGRDER